MKTRKILAGIILYFIVTIVLAGFIWGFMVGEYPFIKVLWITGVGFIVFLIGILSALILSGDIKHFK